MLDFRKVRASYIYSDFWRDILVSDMWLRSLKARGCLQGKKGRDDRDRDDRYRDREVREREIETEEQNFIEK